MSIQTTYGRHLRFLAAGCLTLLLFLLPRSIAADDFYQAASAPDSVTAHGSLQVTGTVLTDRHGNVFTPVGITTDDLLVRSDLLCQETMKSLRETFRANLVRLVVPVQGERGLSGGDEYTRALLRSNAYTALNAAITQDMYVVLSLDLSGPEDAALAVGNAHAFLEDIAAAYGSFPNVLYELDGLADAQGWAAGKAAAAELVSCIRYYAPENVIIIDAPAGPEGLRALLADPLATGNLLYGIKAAPEEKELLSLVSELCAGDTLPLIATGFTIAGREGNKNEQGAMDWLSLLGYYDIGFIYSSLSAADDALLIPSSPASGWDREDMTDFGRFFAAVLKEELPVPAYVPSVTTASTAAAGGSDDGLWSFDSGISVQVTAGDAWSDGVYSYRNYDITIRNDGTADFSGWRLRLGFGCAVGDREYWSCQLGGDGSSRLCIPVDYNYTIPAGSEATIGICIYGAELPTISSVSFE